MAIQKYQDSFSDMMPTNFSSMLDRFFNDSMASRGRVSNFSPQVDAFETEKGYEIEASLPGLKREDIKVDFHQGRLTISGERQFKNEQNDRRYHIVESSYGSFQRSFQLPDTVNPGQIEASFEDGVLRVHVPKDEQKTMRHQIQVKGGQSASGSGQMSERMGQQATDIPVQSSESGDQSKGRSSKDKSSASSSKQGQEVGNGQGANNDLDRRGVGS
ncbi:Hsp20/alpha crystallin family protein [Hymenobacter jejuensis]|uniref:Hsp20/alpha crystallin family protein n=1 Tax=Hymenobacter jejuensis TaxID=2502781 RepID=A0A5B7ZYC2_9BACT|nr:Hsp20/alpha crystallin family protein [Hymenobacter jejuensis]QDA60201.1 Hsp20/alpha crystallin family protein [Hymenobacter jejuensis]